MKKTCIAVFAVLLMWVLGTALATEDFMIPKIEAADGGAEIFRSVVVDDAVHLLSTRRNLYVLDTEAQKATFIPIHNADPEYEQVPDTAFAFHKISKDGSIPDWLQKDASSIDVLFYDGTALYGVNELNGTLYRVDIADGEATLHAISSLDFFPALIRSACPPFAPMKFAMVIFIC